MIPSEPFHEYMRQFAHTIQETEGRKKIADIGFQIPLDVFIREYYPFGVEYLESSDELGDGDCKKWVHDQVDLSYNRRWRGDRARILEGVNPDLKPTHELSEGNLVAYFDKLENVSYGHWGVCVIKEGSLLVESRWGGGGDLFRHPLETLPHKYGNFVEFLEVIK
jgi:hypothetical protein|tara:strand:+ start:89 stop:583 length:495 start_codon:yes stop_codon:yes gene_type:complete